MQKWAKTGIACLLIAWVLLFPPTRALVVFLLPLGSGIDDFLFLAFALVGVVVLFVGGWAHVPSFLNDFFGKKGKRK